MFQPRTTFFQIEFAWEHSVVQNKGLAPPSGTYVESILERPRLKEYELLGIMGGTLLTILKVYELLKKVTNQALPPPATDSELQLLSETHEDD